MLPDVLPGLPGRYLSIAEPVREALLLGRPVVALESTVIAHGLPRPQNAVPRGTINTANRTKKIASRRSMRSNRDLMKWRSPAAVRTYVTASYASACSA